MTMQLDVSDMVGMQNMLADLRGHVNGAKRDLLDTVGSDIVEHIRKDMATEIFPGETLPIMHLGDYAAAIGYDVIESNDDDVSLQIGVDPASRAADYWADVEFGQVWESFDQFEEIEDWALTKFGGDDAARVIQSIYSKFLNGEPSIPQPLLSEYVVFDATGNVLDLSVGALAIVDTHFREFSRNISYWVRDFRHQGRRLAYAIRGPRGRFTSQQGLVPVEEVERRGPFAFPSMGEVGKPDRLGQGRRFGFAR